MENMKPLTTGQEYLIKRLISFFSRHHSLITHFLLYNSATDCRVLYYIFEHMCLLIVTVTSISKVKVELYKNTEYHYLISDPTIILNSTDRKFKYIETEK